MTLQLGDRGPVVRRWREVMNACFGGATGLYARLNGPLPTDTDEFGLRAQAWQKEYQFRTGQAASKAAASGVVSDKDLADLKIVLPHRPIWIYSAPGSGVPGYIGPPFDLGEWCRTILNLNHVWLDYPIGGYLGLMGGDRKFSYNDIIGFEDAALEAALDRDPDLQRAMAARRIDPKAAVDWEGWFTGYSQSADGMKRAVARLFGPGGKYELVRDRINGVIVFGDPTRPGTGIARLVWTAPQWLEQLTTGINNPSPTPDFYAFAEDDIRPLFYQWFVEAEAELPFVIYTAQIILPALLNLVAPTLGGLAFGGLASPLAIPLLGAATGLGVDTLGPMIGGVLGAKSQPNPKLIKLLSVQGLLSNLPQLIKLLLAMPGIAVHGDYYAPKPEFADPSKGWGPRSGIQVGFDTVAGFRR